MNSNTMKSTHMNTYKLVVLFAAGAGFLGACGNRQQPQAAAPQAVPVTVVPVSQEIAVGVEKFPATVVALNETELRAEVNGYLTGIFVADGATVNKGQKLYEIDRVRYEAAEQQARASLQMAEANLARIRRDVERYRKLAEQDAIAKQTLDYAETDLSNAEAQVASARAALVTAQTNLERSTITAPFSGTIGIAQVRTGALVSAGTTLINTLSSTDPIAVDFPINERHIARFSELQRRSTIERDSIITLQLPDGSVYDKPGRIIALDRAVNPATGTLTVRVSFPNNEGKLRAGMNASVQVRTASETEQLVIPYRAVQEQLGHTSVYVLTDSSTVEQRRIRLGLKLGERVVVSEGLAQGETVVTDGIINLRPGAKVQVTQPANQ